MPLALSAAFNLRDLGGLPTSDGNRIRDGLLWRSDALHRLSPADLDSLSSLGLRTVVDLRSAQEVERTGTLAQRDGVLFHSVPVFTDIRALAMPVLADDTIEAGAEAMVAMYLQMLDIGGEGIGRAIELLGAEGALPGLFHCAAGKDRTGLVAAFVLDTAGVQDEVIAADYARTEASASRAQAWLAENDPEHLKKRADYPNWVTRARPEAMLGTLRAVREAHGSVREFLLSLGVRESTLARLRAELVDG